MEGTFLKGFCISTGWLFAPNISWILGFSIGVIIQIAMAVSLVYLIIFIIEQIQGGRK
jgi:hypothetical protein